MKIEFDEEKRRNTLERRGLDFNDAPLIFANEHITFPDLRNDYGEDRFITFGFLKKRMVVLVWTKRKEKIRIISMRKANEREQQRIALVER